MYDSKLLNLENLYPRQSVDPEDEPEQSNCGAACLDNRYRSRESKNQEKEVIPDDQKPPILLNLNGVETSTNAQNAQAEWSLVRRRGA